MFGTDSLLYTVTQGLISGKGMQIHQKRVCFPSSLAEMKHGRVQCANCLICHNCNKCFTDHIKGKCKIFKCILFRS